jgi:hypothetical protein
MLNINSTQLKVNNSPEVTNLNIKNTLLQITENSQGKLILSFSEKNEKIKNFSEKLLLKCVIISEKIL